MLHSPAEAIGEAAFDLARRHRRLYAEPQVRDHAPILTVERVCDEDGIERLREYRYICRCGWVPSRTDESERVAQDRFCGEHLHLSFERDTDFPPLDVPSTDEPPIF